MYITWGTAFNIGDSVLIIDTQEEAVIAGINITMKVDEDDEETGSEQFNVRKGNGQKLYGLSENQLVKLTV